ncbi:MAG: NAD(P)-dependent glycerol-1-phosphate dehydrogenase [Candidatus Hadarchaeum sp.]|uniref:NAD(P)-dependent glycerol-1-phosphate dehydrogenase n=1 Tax=Candidatus Hadarchaeum sp. TaxID=2883567 RepID=UPI003D0E6B71
MKEPKKIGLPREVWMGPRVISKVAHVCRKLELGKRALIVADPTTFELVGSKVKSQLERAGFEVNHTIINEADLPTVAKVREISGGKIDFFLGVGGGRCIDVAKLASFQEGRPFVSVPTAASHDGIASSRASIKGGKKPTSIETHAPIAIIADTLIIRRAPHRLLAAGCGDIISNLTAVRDWQMAHRIKGEPYSEYAAMLSLVSYQIVMENAGLIRKRTEESVREVVKALISSSVAMAIAGSSRPASGSEHLFSHALDITAPKPALHGEQCGVGTIMMAYLHGEDWVAVKEALKTIGAPTNAKELGIPPKYIVKALTIAHKIRPDRYTVLKDGLSRRAAERLAKITGVI